MSPRDDDETARHYDDALRRAGELLDDGNTVADVMELLDDEWLGSSIWPSADATLWREVENLAAKAHRSAVTS